MTRQQIYKKLPRRHRPEYMILQLHHARESSYMPSQMYWGVYHPWYPEQGQILDYFLSTLSHQPSIGW